MARPHNFYKHWMYGTERDTMPEPEPKEEEKESTRYLGRRVSNEGPSVHTWSEQTGNGSSWYDLCNTCAGILDHHPHIYDETLVPWNGDPVGEDGWGGDCAHPCYDDDEYRCAVCKDRLGGY